jgi:phenylacetate-CoA ligase
MTLRAESAATGADLATALANDMHALTKLKGEVEIVPPGGLPNDGLVIADERKYS